MISFSRIFLIDDNEMDNVFHEVILRRSGFTGEVLVFEDAQQALDYLQADETHAPTLIFLDLNMPRMDGFKFASKAEVLLQRALSATTTIVMLSSSSAGPDREKAAGISAISGFIVKPLIEQQARELISGNLDSARFT